MTTWIHEDCDRILRINGFAVYLAGFCSSMIGCCYYLDFAHLNDWMQRGLLGLDAGAEAELRGVDAPRRPTSLHGPGTGARTTRRMRWPLPPVTMSLVQCH